MVLLAPPPPLLKPPRTVTVARKAWEILGAEGTEENSYKAPKVPKLMYTVIPWYRFVVWFPHRGGDSHLVTPPPFGGGNRPDKRGGGFKGGGVYKRLRT